MRKMKKFDCVEMKREIQQQIDKEYAGLSTVQINKLQAERILNNSILGPLLRKYHKHTKNLTPIP